MFTLETFERQLSAVMETLVEAAVTELGRLLTESSAARQRSAPAAVPARMREAAPAERRQHLQVDVTVTRAPLRPRR